MGLQNWVAKNCKKFSSELAFKSRAIRGFQKGITLGGRISVSACKVMGGWGGWVGGWVGGLLHFSVTPVQTWSQELGVRSWEFRVGSLSGLCLDFRLTIIPCCFEDFSDCYL